MTWVRAAMNAVKDPHKPGDIMTCDANSKGTNMCLCRVTRFGKKCDPMYLTVTQYIIILRRRVAYSTVSIAAMTDNRLH